MGLCAVVAVSGVLLAFPPKKVLTGGTANGETVDTESVLTAGEYRLKCYFSTADGIAEGFVYCVIEN